MIPFAVRVVFVFFFFKQKTAYEIVSRDWSSDVCSSDLMATPGYESFVPCDTASDDVCLIAFTSGTTGEPKGTMHFHRDMLATCDSYGRCVLRAQASDRFIGSPPPAFTFGLGGLLFFSPRVGAPP